MITLIGSRWKCRKVRSRGVLICPVSRAELCIAQLENSHCSENLKLEARDWKPSIQQSRFQPPELPLRISYTEHFRPSSPSGRNRVSSVRFWWFGGGVTPVLIPNTAVKPASGDGTHRYRWGE